MDAVPTTLPELTRVLRMAEGIDAVMASLRARGAGTIDGTWGSSAALAIATLLTEAPSTILVVIAHPGDVEPWSNDLASFCPVRPVVFPALESWPPDQSRFDDTPRKRLRIVQQLGTQPPKLLLSTFSGLMQPVPEKAALQSRGRRLAQGDTLDLDEFGNWLVANGYKRVDAVEMPGEYSRRGGILDLYSTDAEDPVRLEFFGDEIESIRPFSSGTQRSLGELTSVNVLGSEKKETATVDRGHLTEHLPADAWVIFVEFGDLKEQGKFFLESVDEVKGLFTTDGVMQMLTRFPSVMLSAMPRPGLEAVAHLRVESVERFSGNVTRIREELDSVARQDRVMIACHNEAEIHRLTEVLSAGALAQSDRLRLVTGSIRAGFRLVEHGFIVIGSHELFHREQTAAGQKTGDGLPRRRIESRAIDSFLELRDGDLVVHVVHGIARFRGMQMVAHRGENASAKANASMEECLILEFREGTKVYVPVSKIDLVQKYVGGSKSDPELSKFGGTAWAKKVSKVEEAVADMASDMLQLQAVREAQTGFAYQTDTDWQKEFEAAFPFQETPDQLTAIEEIKQDMQRARPMDRLLCGDVGYGKTEVAIRAVFKAIDSGKQVAVLVPTTVLAEQHYRTFKARLAEYPFTVEALSRFRTTKEQNAVLKGLKSGSVDVVIGTHRLVSADVTFKDLGLVIIDEEQRFGVHHKERLKHLRSMVDVLTMTATPIPRTLHLSLLGIREISNLETPPPERLPVETRIVRWDDKLIRAAILRELNRDGQVYFVHNRVMDIEAVATKIKIIVPEANIVIGHGQMKEGELEEAMVKFVRKEAHILVATTIIESGLDIPNANTIFINEADHYGLAELHQLRGRVGRQKNRAYAYLLIHADKGVSGTAALRLKAIEEFNELGAGFKIAMRDLEIRGAGNILGMQQSGHIESVGYEMYCSLLENAVRQMKHLPLRTPLEVNVDLPWPAFLPREYVPGQKLRLEVYRRLARVRDPKRLEDFRQELRDRYGPIPESAEWLLRLAEVKLFAARWQISSVHMNGPNVVLGYRNVKKAHQVCDRSEGRLKVIDEKDIYGRWFEGEDAPEAMYHLLKHWLRGAKED